MTASESAVRLVLRPFILGAAPALLLEVGVLWWAGWIRRWLLARIFIWSLSFVAAVFVAGSDWMTLEHSVSGIVPVHDIRRAATAAGAFHVFVIVPVVDIIWCFVFRRRLSARRGTAARSGSDGSAGER